MHDDIKKRIRTIPHWPRKGVMFRDITTLINDAGGLRASCDRLHDHYRHMQIDAIAGIESRGFTFGCVLAYLMNKGFVLLRKPGKLPAKTVSQEYKLEYGTDSIEMHEDAIRPGDRVLIVDDLLATGGTMRAACTLVEKLGGNVVGCAFVIELPELGGRKALAGYDVFSLVEFEGE